MRLRIAAVGLLIFFASQPALAVCHSIDGFYTNVDGNRVHDPECVSGHVAGERAICRDGSHSFSEHHAGTCSHHGGVAQWE